MGYYEGEKSVGLGPIVLALTGVTAVAFGIMFTMFGHLAQEPVADDFANKVDRAAEQQQVTVKHNRV